MELEIVQGDKEKYYWVPKSIAILHEKLKGEDCNLVHFELVEESYSNNIRRPEIRCDKSLIDKVRSLIQQCVSEFEKKEWDFGDNILINITFPIERYLYLISVQSFFPKIIRLNENLIPCYNVMTKEIEYVRQSYDYYHRDRFIDYQKNIYDVVDDEPASLTREFNHFDQLYGKLEKIVYKYQPCSYFSFYECKKGQEADYCEDDLSIGFLELTSAEELMVTPPDVLENGGDEDYVGVCSCSSANSHACYKQYDGFGHRNEIIYNDIHYFVLCHS